MKETFKKLSKLFMAFMIVLIMVAPIQKVEAATKVSAPKIISVSNVSSGVTVKWSKVAGATGYYVYRKTTGGYKKIATVKNKSTVTYTDKTAKSGTIYTYAVKTYKGTAVSNYGAAKKIKRLSNPSVTVANTSSGVKVSWSKVTGAATYRIYYQKSGKWVKLTDTTFTTYTDKTVTRGSSRTYTVRAVSGSYMSSYGSKAIEYLAQPAPSVIETDAGVKVSWKKVTGAAKYSIYYKENSKWVKLADTAFTSYLDKTCTSGTRIYTVKAISGNYVSSYCSGVQYVHTHTFIDQMGEIATCTKYGLMHHICSKCSIMYTTEIKPIGHNYISEITKEASCTEAGVRTYTCSGCGDFYTEEIPMTGHNYAEATITTVTCENDGVVTYICTNCGHSYEEIVPAAGHNYTGEVSKKASCEEEGVRTYTCSSCGEIYTETITIDEHDWVETTENVAKSYHICNGCGEKFYFESGNQTSSGDALEEKQKNRKTE